MPTCHLCSSLRNDFLCSECFNKGMNSDSIEKLNQSLAQTEPNQSIITKQSLQLDIHRSNQCIQTIKAQIESKRALIQQSKERNIELTRKNNESRQRIQRLHALSKNIRSPLPIDQIILNTQTIQHSIVQYQRKAIQELIKIFRLRKYKKNDKTEEYRIASTGFQITNIRDEQQVDAAMGYILQFVSTLAHYLNFDIPLMKFCPASSTSTIIYKSKTYKLYTTGNKEFMDALGLLNYFILCLGDYAGIGKLSPENTLENIVKLCLEYGGIRDQSIGFDYELENVVKDMCDNHYILL